MRSWVLWNIFKFVGNESHENIPEGLRTMLGCIHNLFCNVLFLSNYCVTTTNELPATFASPRNEVVKCYVLFGIIDRVSVNSAELHKVNESYKFRIGASNHWPSACNNWPSACNNWLSIIHVSRLIEANLVPQTCFLTLKFHRMCQVTIL
jgi:hypothetical protein